MYRPNHYLYRDQCETVMLNYSCFEQLKKNHLCKIAKTAVLELSPVALQYSNIFEFPVFRIQIFAHSEQLAVTYLVKSSY